MSTSLPSPSPSSSSAVTGERSTPGPADDGHPTRRRFLGEAAIATGGALSLGSLTAAGTTQAAGAASEAMTQPAPDDAAGPAADDAFAAPLTGADIRAASRILDLPLTDAETEALLEELQRRRNGLARRRTPAIPNDVAPAETFRPLGLSPASPPAERRSRPSDVDPGPLPADPGSIAHRPVTHLAAWIRRGDLTSRRLTRLYLDRIERLDPQLRAVVTATARHAMDRAARADAALAAGDDRGVLHGIPYGAKDLLDTDGIRTTWGATPYADRIAARNAAVIDRLDAAHAVLVAKTTLGALAYGDIWFDGRTNSPWNLERGSSGSSAGSAAGTAAGLFAFSLGTETYGSIVSPSMRCGTTGLRPTFGRVARSGAMALCWSLDKIGPICRTVEDCAHVLRVIDGADPGDPSSLDLGFDFDPRRPLTGVRVAVDPGWFGGRRANPIDGLALSAMRRLAAAPGGPTLVEFEGPSTDGAGDMLPILEIEAAAAFQELTLSGDDDQLVWQAPQAWPNTFRGAHFHSAVDLVQAQRRRRLVAERMDAVFAEVDVILAPSFAGGLNLMTNFTGHPCLVLRAGFDDGGEPRGVSLFGRLGGDDRLAEVGVALERELAVWDRTPPGF